VLNTIWFFAISVWNVMRQTSYLEFWVIFAENWKRNCKMENNGKVFCSRCKSQLRWNNFFFSQNNIFFSKNIIFFFGRKFVFCFVLLCGEKLNRWRNGSRFNQKLQYERMTFQKWQMVELQQAILLPKKWQNHLNSKWNCWKHVILEYDNREESVKGY